MSRDQTPKPPATSALFERAGHFRALLETIPQQVWTATPDGNLDYVNKRVISYFGLSSEEIIGSGWTNVVHPDDLPITLQHWGHSLETGENYETNFRLLGADGVYRWHFVMAAPLRDANGEIIQWVGTSTDISQHKEVEVALAVSEAHLAAAQARAHIGSWELDLNTGKGSASSEWFEIVGHNPNLPMPSLEEFIASVHPDDQLRFATENARLMTGQGETQMDFRLVMPDGSYRWIDARVKVIADEQGHPQRLVGTTQDITARKLTEEALLESEASLAAAQARAKMGSWRRDLNTGEATWSGEMYRIFGRDPASKPPSFRSFMHAVHPDDRHTSWSTMNVLSAKATATK